MGRRMRYISLFSGVEAATLAWETLGWEPVAFCEIDDFSSAVLAHHYPDVPNLGDITKVDWSEVIERHGRPEVVVGGSPCFTAGTLVLTDKRFTPIEDIKVGDYVLTHKGNFKRVVRVGGHENADTVMLKGQGSVGIECTANHPFWSTKLERTWNNDRRKYDTFLAEPEFVYADHMGGRMWLNVTNVPELPVPGFRLMDCRAGQLDEISPINEDFFYFVGRWLGDGCVFPNPNNEETCRSVRRREIILSCGKAEFEGLNDRLSKISFLNFYVNEVKDTVQFRVTSKQLYEWIVENFGATSHGKHLPTWAMGMDRRLRKSLFDGYFDADGCVIGDCEKLQTSSVGKELTLGMKVLAGSLGMVSSVVRTEPSRQCVIESPLYIQKYCQPNRLAYFDDSVTGFWGRVRNVVKCRTGVTVYNLEVEDDHSYTVDAVGCSNCQSFSIAGGRESLSGESRLMFEYVRALAEIQPTWFLWENVPGVLNTRDNAFAQLLREVQDIGYGSVAWRVLDAQFFGVAQRRRRVFLVGHLGEGGSAGAVLFDPESLRGDNPSGKQKRQELARAAGRGPGARGGAGDCLTPWDSQSIRIFGEESAFPTLQAGENSGQQRPSVLQAAGFKYHQGAQAGSIGYEDGQSPTLTADYHQPAVALQTGHTSGNGSGVSTDDVSYTLSTSSDQAAAFAQNTRDEVRIVGGDGSHVGALTASPGAKQQSYVLQAFSGGSGGDTNMGLSDDCSPTITVRQPVDVLHGVAMTQYGLEVAGTLTARADSSPCADRGQNIVCMASGQANAEIADDGTSPTITCLHEQPIVCMADDNESAAYVLSNGDDVIGTLCARDCKGIVSQYVGEGKVICQRTLL